VERDPEANDIERIVGLEHIDPENLHVRRWNSVADGTSFTRKFVPGQTLFGKRRAYQRKVAYAEFEGICSGDILTFEPKNRKVLMPEILPFICQSDAFFDHALDTSAGSLSPRTSWTALKDFEFPLPPINEQKRITEILWAADEARECYLTVINHTKSSKQTFSFNLVANAQFRRRKLQEITVKISDGEHLSPKFIEKGVPILSAKDVLEDGVSLDDCRFISDEAAFKSRQRCDPERGDLLIVSRGATIGRSCLVDTDEVFALMGSVIQIRPKIEEICPEYLESFFSLDSTKRSLLKMSGSTAQQAIYLKHIKDLQVFVPSINVQRQVISYIDKFNEAMKSALESCKALDSLVKTIIKSTLSRRKLDTQDV
jgi:type I restriction enzyme S subunit